jgi:hypothetical protein
LCGLTGTEIALWDSWGLDEETYGNDFLMTLLRGDLPSGYEMVGHAPPHQGRLATDQQDEYASSPTPTLDFCF